MEFSRQFLGKIPGGISGENLSASILCEEYLIESREAFPNEPRKESYEKSRWEYWKKSLKKIREESTEEFQGELSYGREKYRLKELCRNIVENLCRNPSARDTVLGTREKTPKKSEGVFGGIPDGISDRPKRRISQLELLNQFHDKSLVGSWKQFPNKSLKVLCEDLTEKSRRQFLKDYQDKSLKECVKDSRVKFL